MNKIDLSDVTFLIPIRVDSKERLENLNLVIEFIKSNFNTKIVVLEADIKERVQHPLIDQKIFVEDHDLVFHRTMYLNLMTSKSTSEFIAIWDADVLTSSEQITESVNKLRKNKVDVVFPYDGSFYKVPEIIKNVYKEKRELKVLSINRKKFLLYYWYHFVGGAFIVNREAYIESGMENENFYGWGPEDEERVKRWEILGYQIERIEGPMFHFDHPRKSSWFGSRNLEIQNRKELINVCKMNKIELLEYVKDFVWNYSCD